MAKMYLYFMYTYAFEVELKRADLIDTRKDD